MYFDTEDLFKFLHGFSPMTCTFHDLFEDLMLINYNILGTTFCRLSEVSSYKMRIILSLREWYGTHQ